MLEVSQEVAYLSSVVKFISVPAEIGISASPVVFPVRISGPLVSRAMATWRPFSTFSASRALSITDSEFRVVSAGKGSGSHTVLTVVFVTAVREVHSHNVQAGSAKLVDSLHRVGLGADCADDGGTTEVALGLVGSIELGKPVDSAAQLEMVESSSRHRESESTLVREPVRWSC